MKKIRRYRVRLDSERPICLADGSSASSPASVSRVAQLAIGDEASETLIVVAVNGRGRVVDVVEVARGGASMLSAYAPEVLRAALLCGVNGFVLAHNHPSGDPTPSSEDAQFTKRVREGAEAVGLTLIDHVVVAPDGGYVSMLEAGLL